MRLALLTLLLIGCRQGSVPADGGPREPLAHDGGGDASAIAMKPVPCIPKAAHVSLAVDNEQSALCWAGRCITLEINRDEATIAASDARPLASLHPGAIRDRDGGLAACVDGACTPLGPNVTAAIRGARSDPAVTTDRKLIVIGTDVWRTNGDRRVALTPSRKVFGKDPAKPIAISVAVDWLVVTWVSATCPDPDKSLDPACGRFSQLVDSTGANRGDDLAWFRWGALGQLDDDLMFVTSRGPPVLALLDLSTGKLRWEQRYGVAFALLDAVRARPGLLVMLLRHAFLGYRVIEVIAGREHPIEITTFRYLPFCER